MDGGRRIPLPNIYQISTHWPRCLRRPVAVIILSRFKVAYLTTMLVSRLYSVVDRMIIKC
jgi:hypothetical protein